SSSQCVVCSTLDVECSRDAMSRLYPKERGSNDPIRTAPSCLPMLGMGHRKAESSQQSLRRTYRTVFVEMRSRTLRLVQQAQYSLGEMAPQKVFAQANQQSHPSNQSK